MSKFEELKKRVLEKKQFIADNKPVQKSKIDLPPMDSKKTINEVSKDVLFKNALFELKMDIVTLFSMLVEKDIKDGCKKKDVEELYMQFLQEKKHIINKLDLKNGYISEVECSEE